MEELRDRKGYVKAMMEDGVAVLEGTTTWCPQCKAIAPFVEKLIKKYPEARFYQYDVEQAEDIAQELGARQMPTFSIFKDGGIVEGVTGAKAQELEKAIRESYGDGKVVELEE